MSGSAWFRVLRIDEADFGCEGLPEGCEQLAELTLKAPDGTRRTVTAEERLLAAQGIDVGSRVTVENGEVRRFPQER